MAGATLPHEREKLAVHDWIDDCLVGRNKFILVITSGTDDGGHFIKQAHQYASTHPRSHSIKLHRQYVEFDNGAVIKFVSSYYSELMYGLTPDRIVLCGKIGELWYAILGMMRGNVNKIEAVA